MVELKWNRVATGLFRRRTESHCFILRRDPHVPQGASFKKTVVSTGAKQEQMLPPEVLQAPGSRVVVVQGHVVQVRH